MCEQATYAMQQIAPWFDHLVASREQQRTFEAEHLPQPSEKVEGLFELTKMK